MNTKIKILIALNHIASVIGLIYGDYSWLLASLMGWMLINKIGGEIGLHRYLCHRSFKTSIAWHWILIVLASLNCFGPPLAWVGVHRKHHHHSDTNGDPHGAQSAWRVWSTFWQPFTIENRYVADMLKLPEQIFIYRWYFWLIGVVYLALMLIDWQLPVFFISIPSVLSFHFAGMVNTICHRFGEREFTTDDHSYNNRLVNLLTLGSGLHNTHHAYPTRWDNRTRAWDIDLPAWIIRHLLIRNGG